MHQENICSNCNSELTDIYCSKCGQKNVGLLTFKEILTEFFDNIFSLDSKLFISLKYLIIKPGYLTLEYWSGKKSRYISPFRLYLVLSVLYFFISPIISDGMLITTEEDIPIPENYSGTLWFEFDESGDSKKILKKLEYFIGFNVNKGIKMAYERRMTVQAIIYSSSSAALFLLMPLMGVILLKLLYRNNYYLYSHHLITTLHFHSFIFLILTINNILSYLLSEVLLYTPIILVIIYLIYSVIMFFKIYQNSIFITLFKTLLLNIIYGAFIFLSMAIIIVGKMFFIGFYS